MASRSWTDCRTLARTVGMAKKDGIEGARVASIETEPLAVQYSPHC